MFLDHFKELPDHRQAGDVSYPLEEILLLTPWRLTRAGQSMMTRWQASSTHPAIVDVLSTR
jgi:hypothetical protein